MPGFNPKFIEAAEKDVDQLRREVSEEMERWELAEQRHVDTIADLEERLEDARVLLLMIKTGAGEGDARRTVRQRNGKPGKRQQRKPRPPVTEAEAREAAIALGRFDRKQFAEKVGLAPTSTEAVTRILEPLIARGTVHVVQEGTRQPPTPWVYEFARPGVPR